MLPTSVRRVHAILRKALPDAVRWGRIERNASELADPPPTRLVQASRPSSMSTWTEAELRYSLEVTSHRPLHPAWLFAATTGVRRSELLALKWSDVNLAGGTVTVRHALVAGPDDYRIEDEQKSVASGRTVHLHSRTRAMLDAHRAAQQETQAKAGPTWNPDGLVFPHPEGSWWNPPAITLAFRRAVDAAEGPGSDCTTSATPARACCWPPGSI